ncbi:MAG: GNAT family N-acetyltransferase [Verrucomicrobiota bacterium]
MSAQSIMIESSITRESNVLFEPVAAPADSKQVMEEISRLNAAGPLVSQSRYDVFLANADAIPAVLHEIGRLREISFRQVGEGSGYALDLDPFDQTYLHLFLWDRESCAVAGAYRIGRTDTLLAEFGPAGLYTSTLFELNQPFLDHLNPGLELGRSFIAPDYQRSIHPLALLWRGICRLVSRFPRYTRLFGPVSISNDYSPISQEVIVRFMRENRQNQDFADWVRPLRPYNGIDLSAYAISDRFHCIEDVSAVIASIEPDKKGVPVLLRQYLKLNATLLEFNRDLLFANVLDALVLVDLRDSADDVLGRYMGKDALSIFRAR